MMIECHSSHRAGRPYSLLFCYHYNAFPPTHGKEDKTGNGLKSAEGAEEQFLKLVWHKADIGNIPKTIGKGPLNCKACAFDVGNPFGGAFQGNVRRVLVADPFVAFPRLEQEVEVRRGKDERAARFDDAADLLDRFLRVRQMLNDMFNDNDVKSFLNGSSCALAVCRDDLSTTALDCFTAQRLMSQPNVSNVSSSCPVRCPMPDPTSRKRDLRTPYRRASVA